VISVLDKKRNVAHSVAVLFDMLGGRMVGLQRRRQNEIDVILL